MDALFRQVGNLRSDAKLAVGALPEGEDLLRGSQHQAEGVSTANLHGWVVRPEERNAVDRRVLKLRRGELDSKLAVRFRAAGVQVSVARDHCRVRHAQGHAVRLVGFRQLLP